MFSLSLNSKPIALAKIVATAGLLSTVVQALPAQSATLDWGSVRSGNSTLFNSTTGRFINATNNIAVSGGGTVNLTLGTIADINNISRVQGIPASSSTVNGFDSSFSPAPAISTFLNGSSTTASTLYLQQDGRVVANAVYAGIKFNNPGGVSGLTFTLFDVDNSSGSLTGNSWQDRVIVRGLLNGNSVASTATPNIPANISINGAGTTYGSVAGATVLDGLKNIGNDLDAANVTISFAGPVDQLYIDFTQAPGSLSTTNPNPASHGIGIGNMTYQAVPEPLTLLGAATAIAFGTAFKRRSAQSKNRD
jgi:hypothetical protein